ncbi:MAG TPA: plastocyanin/azurin family copper-binding protein [Longimicrobiales bacterium]|nr:plastocyanin/azurin family copper-binding protein [Longimicrobiales bacterium]
MIRRWCMAGLLLLVACTACGDPPAEREPADAPEAVGAAPPQGVWGVAPEAVGGTPSVVLLDGPDAEAPAPSAEPPHIDQLGLAFTPTALVVRVGETVLFTNSETVTHNVHIREMDSGETVLNVDTDPAGGAEYVFESEGGYDVTCDVHPGMRAFIYATEAPYAVLAERTGAFVVPDVPAGAYTLSVWSADPGLRSEQEITVSGASTEVRLGF